MKNQYTKKELIKILKSGVPYTNFEGSINRKEDELKKCLMAGCLSSEFHPDFDGRFKGLEEKYRKIYSIEDLYKSDKREYLLGTYTIDSVGSREIVWVSKRTYDYPFKVQLVEDNKFFVVPISERWDDMMNAHFPGTLGRYALVAFSPACWEGEESMKESFKGLERLDVYHNGGAYGKCAWGGVLRDLFDDDKLEPMGLYELAAIAYYGMQGKTAESQIVRAYLQTHIDAYMKGITVKHYPDQGRGENGGMQKTVINEPDDLAILFGPFMKIHYIEFPE